MNRFKVGDLENINRFRLLDELPHQDLTIFIARYYWQNRSLIVITHYLFSLACLAIWIVVGFQSGYEFGQWLETFGKAVIAFILIVPIHEAIHGAAYKLFGARSVRFAISLRKFYAYAIADKFVVDRRSFALIALAPFLIINGILIAIFLFYEPSRFFTVCLLLVHTGGTSGDWALLNYLWLNRNKEIYTYDDAAKARSYFYELINPLTEV